MLQFGDFYFHADDGLRVHARIYSGSGRSTVPIVYLPGLTRNSRGVHPLATRLASMGLHDRPIISFDYRGRGESGYDADWRNYTVEREAADIVAGLDLLGIRRAHFIGVSRGGLICHVIAVTRPDLIVSAVLSDVGPAIEHQGLAEIRDGLGNAVTPDSLAAAIEIQKSTNAKHLPDETEDGWKAMAHAVYRIEGDKVAEDFDPLLLNQLSKLDPSIAFPDRWTQFEALTRHPVLLLRGRLSTLLTAEVAEEMETRPNVTLVTVENQGHAPLLQSGELPKQIASFFDSAEDLAG